MNRSKLLHTSQNLKIQIKNIFWGNLFYSKHCAKDDSVNFRLNNYNQAIARQDNNYRILRAACRSLKKWVPDSGTNLKLYSSNHCPWGPWLVLKKFYIEKIDGFKKCFFVSNAHKGVNRREKQAIQSCAVYQEQLFNLCGTFMVCLALRLWSHFSMASRWFWTLPNHLFRYWSENCADAKFIRTLDEWRGGCTLEHGGVVHS